MEKKGYTLVEALIVIAIVGILLAIVAPQLIKPKIVVYIDYKSEKKALVYQVPNRYDCKRLYFRDVGFDGTLNSVKHLNGLISEPNTLTIKSASSDKPVSWDTWVNRFEQEIRPEAVIN